MKSKAVFIVILLFLAVTSFFWFQILGIRDLPTSTKPSAKPAISAKEAEAFIKLAQELLIDYREPVYGLYGRDPFVRDTSQQIDIELKVADKFILSSITYTKSSSLAVINGEIYAEGDTIYDPEIGLQFMVESIEEDRVEISDGTNKYMLRMATLALNRR